MEIKQYQILEYERNIILHNSLCTKNILFFFNKVHNKHHSQVEIGGIRIGYKIGSNITFLIQKCDDNFINIGKCFNLVRVRIDLICTY